MSMIDYTLAKSNEKFDVKTDTTIQKSKSTSMQADLLFVKETGKGRSVYDHVLGKTTARNWFISPEFRRKYLHYDEDQAVFVQVGNNEGCKGWLSFPEIRKLMVPTSNGHDIGVDVLHPMSTFSKKS